MRIYKRKSIAERFWPKVKKLPGRNACWLWTGCIDKRGYGRFGVGRNEKPQVKNAHVVAWELANGSPMPKGMVGCHDCDNPSCVRVGPGHVFAGTRKRNQRDMVKRGRAAMGTRHGLTLHPESISRGEHRPLAKLTEDEVREIRRVYAAGGISCKLLGTKFSVSEMVVSKIVRGLSWKHVKD